MTLRRWSQWISSSYPRSVYDGEEQKVPDWESSLPAFVVDSIVARPPRRESGRSSSPKIGRPRTVAIAIDRLARERGVRNTFTLMWNANSVYGWERIDWSALRSAAAITAVSKYLKIELSRLGVRSLLIPNGIDTQLHERANPLLLVEMKQALSVPMLRDVVPRNDEMSPSRRANTTVSPSSRPSHSASCVFPVPGAP